MSVLGERAKAIARGKLGVERSKTTISHGKQIGLTPFRSDRLIGQMNSSPIVRVEALGKRYSSGFQALQNVDLQIGRSEIFALLGPNGAGKTTLINIICGLVNASTGTVAVGGFDVVREYKKARAKIGLVPQELSVDMFESVGSSVAFSRGLFGKAAKPAHLEALLKALSLWDKRDSKIRTLSGGMKRRVMIAKALSHEPEILFLDEPTAGVDVALRRDMWAMVRALREGGTTIILTTHYIEEAQEMADRIGVINKGEIVIVEEKDVLMAKFGKKKLTFSLSVPLRSMPDGWASDQLELSPSGQSLTYTFDAQSTETGITALMKKLNDGGIEFGDLETEQSSLEDIFLGFVGSRR